jgi:hypothetical protein
MMTINPTFLFSNIYSLSSTTSLTVQRKHSIVNLAFSRKYDTLSIVIPTEGGAGGFAP